MRKGNAPVNERNKDAMLPQQFKQRRRPPKVTRQRRHIRRMVHSIPNPRLGLRKQVVMPLVLWQLHHSLAVSGPPHTLLFGDRGDGADAGTDEAEEGDVGGGGGDDVADVGVPRTGVFWREPGRELLLVAGGEDDEAVPRVVRQLSMDGVAKRQKKENALWLNPLLLHPLPYLLPAPSSLLTCLPIPPHHSLLPKRHRPRRHLDDSRRLRVLRRVVILREPREESRAVLIRSVEVGRRGVRFVEEYVGATESFRGELADPLVAACAGTCEDVEGSGRRFEREDEGKEERTRQEPEHSLDHKVGDEPTQVSLRHPRMDVRALKKVGNQPIDRQRRFAIERDSEEAEVVERLGERQEPAPRAKHDFFRSGLDTCVREVHPSLARAEDEDPLARELGAVLVFGGVEDLLRPVRGDALDAGDGGDLGDDVETGGDGEESGAVGCCGC